MKIALIAHDKKKDEMIEVIQKFVRKRNKYGESSSL